MMDAADIEIPEEWKRIDLDRLRGVLLVVGPPDSGKTTFARYLHARLSAQCAESGACTALIDGDPGQSSLGPPSTLTQVTTHGLNQSEISQYRRIFLGSVSPRGHMLTTLVGAARLVNAALGDGAEMVIYDTSGLIDASQGGVALKQAKIDLLQPQTVFAIQKKTELEPLLLPLRRTRRLKVINLMPAPAARERGSDERRRHRQARFSDYFRHSHPVEVDWTSLAVFPMPRFSLNRLVAFEDDQGFALGLGIVTSVERPKRKVTLLTPLDSLEKMNAVRLGNLAVDPNTFRDAQLAH